MRDCDYCGGDVDSTAVGEAVCTNCTMLYLSYERGEPMEPDEPTDPTVFAAVMHEIASSLEARLNNVKSRLDWYEVKATGGLTMSPEGIMSKPLHQQGGRIVRG